MEYPLVVYARKIGKSTADFTAKDMSEFTKWWIIQPSSKEMLQAIKAQQKKAAQIGKELQLNRKEDMMGVRHTTVSFQKAQTSRLAEQGIESPINNGEEEIIVHEENEVVCSMELTRIDVDALLWAIGVATNDYAVEGEMATSLRGLEEGLEGV